MASKKARPQKDTVLNGEALAASMLERFEPLIPEAERVAVRSRLTLTLPPAIRLNPAKRSFGTIEELSRWYGWNPVSVSFCAEGYRLPNSAAAPGNTPEHAAGAYYVQDSASMLPVSLIDPGAFDGTPLILDMAASPGGKTTHLVSASGDRGLILANDSGPGRIPALRKVLKTYGAVNQLITNFPGEQIGAWFPERFDVILLDAPCSMQSLVSIDSHPMRPISEREEIDLARRQEKLLTSALMALKPGGQLVYSTCTLSPLEDEGVLDNVLKRLGTAVDVVDVSARLPMPAPGITEYDGHTLDPRTARAIRLWPNRYETAGFFAALLTKRGSIPTETREPAYRPFEKSGYRRPGAVEEREIGSALTSLFGYDVLDDLAARELVLTLRDSEAWAVPARVLDEFAELPAKSIGMRMAFKHASGWIADFDWTTQSWDKLRVEKRVLTPDEAARWQGGQELQLDSISRAKGTNLFLTNENGIPIGIGVVSGARLRNIR